jgi:hypothetical protein
MEDLLFEFLINNLGDKLDYILIPIGLFVLLQLVLIFYNKGVDIKSLIVVSLIFAIMPISIIIHGILSLINNPSMSYNFSMVFYILIPLLLFWILYFLVGAIRKKKDEKKRLD